MDVRVLSFLVTLMAECGPTWREHVAFVVATIVVSYLVIAQFALAVALDQWP